MGDGGAAGADGEAGVGDVGDVGYGGPEGYGAGVGDTGPGSMGGGMTGGSSDTGMGGEGPGGGGGGGGGGGMPTSVLAASTALPVVQPSPKVKEAKAQVPKKVRRRSLLDEEEGGLTPVDIYRRSILGR